MPRGRDFRRSIYERQQSQLAIHRYLHEHQIPCSALLLPDSLKRSYFTAEQLALLPSTYDGGVSRQFYSYCRAVVNRRLVRSKKGYIGLAPNEVQPGDRIYVVKWSRVPLILRPAASRYFFREPSLNAHPLYELVGDAYVHGIMFGEAFSKKAECETFWLV
jgi:hypothetical protein